MSPSTELLSHRKPSSAGASCDTCHTDRQCARYVYSVHYPHENLTFQTFLHSRSCACPCDRICSTPVYLCHATRAGPRHVGVPSRLIIWHPLKAIFFKLFGLGQDWRNFLRVGAKTADNFWRNSFAYGNLSLVAPYFQLFQWCLSAPYRFAPWASAQLACPLVQPCMWHTRCIKYCLICYIMCMYAII
jgi:hypothetical protein